MKNLTKIFILLSLAIGLCSAQTILSTTTLGAAITTTSTNQTGQTIQLASTSTMLSAGSTNQYNTVLYFDQELDGVISVVDSTHVTVKRGIGTGAGSKPTTHANGATVWFGNTANGIAATSLFSGNSGTENWAQCTATTQVALPRINAYWGTKADCLGVGAAGHWARTDAPGYPVLGSTVASATSITPTGTIFTVSGTTTVQTIVVPNGLAPGMSITIIPSGVFTVGTSGNIALGGASVVSKALVMTWNGTSWYMSYIA